MSKIEFEDRTKQGKDKIDIEHLADSFFTGSIKVGLVAGYTPKEILEAFLIASRDLCNHCMEMDIVTAEEVETIRTRAEEIAAERDRLYRESGLADVVKKFVKDLRGKKEDE